MFSAQNNLHARGAHLGVACPEPHHRQHEKTGEPRHNSHLVDCMVTRRFASLSDWYSVRPESQPDSQGGLLQQRPWWPYVQIPGGRRATPSLLPRECPASASPGLPQNPACSPAVPLLLQGAHFCPHESDSPLHATSQLELFGGFAQGCKPQPPGASRETRASLLQP